MTRVLFTELRRSAAGPLLLLALVLNTALLEYRSGHWQGMAAGVTSTAKSNLVLLLPLTLGAAVWHGGRERRAGLEELVSTTARPLRAQRLPGALALLTAAVVGVSASTAAYVGRVLADSGYTGGRWPLSAALLVLAVAAAVAVGLAVGRAFPVPFAAPLITVAGTLLLLMTAYGPAARLNPGADPAQAFTQLRLDVAGAQAALLTGLLVAGLTAALASSSRSRALALAPAAAGIAAGVALLPGGTSPYEPDPAAAAPVCTPGEPTVCMTTLHRSLLPQVVEPARATLRRAALVPGGPTSVVEQPFSSITQDPRVMVLPELQRFELDGGPDQVRYLLGAWQAYRWSGCATDHSPTPEQQASTDVVAAWFAQSAPDERAPAAASVALSRLNDMPEAEQAQRITRMRDALARCAPDPLTVLQ
ncbi:hypothetical protein [Motilibacter deserti]|uniref:ABC-type transport system involved in multi-copper enzyme maturation permease subunit n=1 Tax=Motilibacter deserti TaxID=2714956 RepID=A0ABX0GWV6_9ACTN|nr:hypothetical protein [Motilibacter deserti]NHC15038.1 hypothetical protein [Motilibacter deserti]